MERIILDHPYSNGSVGNVIPEDAQAMLDVFREMRYLHERGEPIYIEFLSGDREGSIARLEVGTREDRYTRKKEPNIDAEARLGRIGWNNEYGHRYDMHAMGTFRWDKRPNKVQAFVGPYGHHAYLRGYEGPTVWKKFDAKAAKAKLLESPDQRDVDGDVLNVGDHVIFINLRYGSGAKLERGTIKRFEATADSRGHEIFTIIESESGEESRTSHPDSLIMHYPRDGR
jgi:hypothetical protein